MSNRKGFRVYTETMRDRDRQIVDARREGHTYRALGVFFDLHPSRIRQIVEAAPGPKRCPKCGAVKP